ncbi:FG-GAP-like repeat-containing protein [Streptoverticillium reticulum]|uniref:FG-GAP-like repeat-containing protein n=1 Tax=Streptoverticillium reticulum TaxID=1433415 RepID=UPI0039BF6DE9
MFGRASRSRSLLAAGFLSTVVGATALTVAPAHAVVGDAAKDGEFAATVKLDIGEGKRGCSGTLVDEQWVLTAGSCFADDPQAVTAGAPQLKTTATVGRADLATEAGQVRDVVELIPRADRDLVMAKLAAPVTGVAPAKLATSAPGKGDALSIAGYGRTKDEWVPDRVHSGAFGVDAVKGATLDVTGKQGAVCKGDTGGPALRTKDGRQELAGVSSTSWQGGCFGSDDSETRKGAVESRVDDVNHWIQQVRSLPKRSMTATGDFDGDGKTDLARLVDYGPSKDGRNQAALWVYTADGKGGFNEPRTVWESGAKDSWNWEASKLVAGDFNGDGKADLGVLYRYGKTSDGRNETGLWTFTSEGADGFEAPRKVWESGKDSWNWDASKIVAGDFNGDGKSDLAVLYNYGKTSDGRNESALMTFTSNGDGFDAPRKVWESGKGSWNWNTSKLAAGDFNGDGKTDLAVLYGYGKTADGRNESALWFTANNSNGFNEPRKVWESGKDSWNWDASKIVAGDFNGDGKTDLAVLYGYDKTSDGRNRTALWVFDGSKNGFDAPRKVWESGAKDSWNWNVSEPAAGDFDGDGKTDISVTYDYGQGADGRVGTGLWTVTSKGADGFEAPRKVWNNSL